MSKVFERIIFNQINEYIEPFLYVTYYVTGFCKSHNTQQHCLLKMLEKWKKALEKGKFVDTIFIYI